MISDISIDQAVSCREQWRARRTEMERQRFGQLSRRALEKGYFSPIDYFLPGATLGLKMASLYRKGRANAQDIQIVEHELSFAQLPDAFDGYRILHLTDLHIDSLPGIEKAICRRLDTLQYDACVLTGDYRYHAYGHYGPRVKRPLQQIISHVKAPDGLYATLGNHDTHAAVDMLEDMGVRVLANEHVTLERQMGQITLTGVDDPHYYYTPAATQTLQQSGTGFKIALVHSPELYQEAAAHHYHLYLCGHTHGGQVCLPNGTPILKNLHKGHHLVEGLWQERQMVGYTSRGCGVSGIPVRFFSRGEVTVFTLRKEG